METHDNDQILWQLDRSLRWSGDLREDHEIDFREALTGLPARPGTINGRTAR